MATVPRNSETKFQEDLTPRKRSDRSARLLVSRWGTLAAGVLGAAALFSLGTSPASANQPDPPDLVRSLTTEKAPADCPTTAPVGTFPAGTNVKALCDRAVAQAPTEAAAAAIRYMFAHLGSPYSQGNRYSVNPPVFDCSSFVARGYTAAGAKIVKGTKEASWVSTFGWTGAYMPTAFEGSNLTRMAVRPGNLSTLLPGDVLIQFSGTNPAGSAGNNGHAQVYIGDGLVIQSGGNHPRSLVNVTRHHNSFNNEWYFRYGAVPATDAFYDKWMQLGGPTGIAGNPVGPAETNTRGGMTRRYERAFIYWSKDTGATAVYGGILQVYAAMGYERSALGLPLTDETDRAVPGSRGNTFQNGFILWSPRTGAHAVYGEVGKKYAAMGAERSLLGLPTSSEVDGPFPGSRANSFQGGAILWSVGTGAHDIHGGIAQRYYNSKVVQILGLPTSSEGPSRLAGALVQNFQRGSIYWSPASGAWEVHGGIRDTYRSIGAETSPLGVPLTGEQPGALPGSVIQRFTGGTMYWSPTTGAHPVYGAIAQRYQAIGAEKAVGLPVSPVGKVGSMQYQTFQRGLIAAAGPSAYEVVSAIGQRYFEIGAEKSVVGLPVGPERTGAKPGVTVQPFQGGVIYRSGSQVWEVHGGILASYRAIGAELSPLGLPLSGELPGTLRGSITQRFTGGTMLWSATTGAHPIYGKVGARFQALGAERVMGLPTSPVNTVGASQYQSFQRGMIVASGSATFEAINAVGERYVLLGGDKSIIGLPVGPERAAAIAGVTMQPFQRGEIYRSSSGAWEVYGGILSTYRWLGGERSGLGAPTSGEIDGPVRGTRMNTFTSGAVVWSPFTGAQPIYGAMWEKYRTDKLAEIIGMPTRIPVGAGVAGAAVQDFQRGAMYWSAATGAHDVYGAIGGLYRSMGGPKSKLGLPTSGEYSVPNGRANDFQGGQIVWDARTGIAQAKYN